MGLGSWLTPLTLGERFSERHRNRDKPKAGNTPESYDATSTTHSAPLDREVLA